MSESTPVFTFKEIDPEGYETLKVISEAVHFNKWTFDTISPFCNGHILEIGSGIGNISSLFIKQEHDITLSDMRRSYRDYLVSIFPDRARSNRVLDIDLVDPQFRNKHASILGSFDSVFALNVVEHIENDQVAIENCVSLLKQGGTLIILVPAFPLLYNSFDRELQHYKRYRTSNLRKLFSVNKVSVQSTFHFNAGGIPGWFWSGNIQKHKIIPPGQMRIFDRLVPFFRLVDRVFFRKIGLSVVIVGRKQG